MDWHAIGTTVWNLLNSPAAIAVLAGGLLWLLNKLYAAKPAWQPFEGTIIAAVKWAEKQIDDATPNKAMRKLDAALDYVVRVYEEARGKPADAKTKAELREGIQIVHADLEAAGSLPAPGQRRAGHDAPIGPAPEGV